ncbi:MAG: hypothetical protein A2Y23_11660 [Clostridiales bacterium GWB2_37_7]|nr:MAG: hypothetical protein A2Y23_11660 [Clostridiales bacterium GWB2_37_7]
MDTEFSRVIIDALTEALERNLPVTIKNSSNNSIIALTATEGKIIMSLSKMPNILDDLIHILSDALGVGPDLVYNRISSIKEDFIIYYVVWIRNHEENEGYIEHEFAMPQNHITFMSPKVISFIKDANIALEGN